LLSVECRMIVGRKLASKRKKARKPDGQAKLPEFITRSAWTLGNSPSASDRLLLGADLELHGLHGGAKAERAELDKKKNEGQWKRQ
jgi:hypothetical protein